MYYSSTSYFSFNIRTISTSTLFPYTTLFRSFECPIFWRSSVHDVGNENDPMHRRGDGHRSCYWRYPHRDDALDRSQDRKSTRLNSSHRTNSYAVFCLKKNNTYIQPVGRNVTM